MAYVRQHESLRIQRWFSLAMAVHRGFGAFVQAFDALL